MTTRLAREQPVPGQASREPSGREGAPEGLAGRYVQVRSATDALTVGLNAEDFVVQSMDDVSPTKWHLAHTSWFWEAFVLGPHLDDYRPFHPDYHYLFNSYYVQAGERHCRAQRGYLSRPTVDEVREYRAHVDRGMVRLLSRDGDDSRASELTSLIEIGLNHEQQHQELILTDLKHLFAVNPLRPVYRAVPEARPGPPVPAVEWIAFEGGVQSIGHGSPGFHFDNESPAHRRFLEPFALASRLVTNGEYLEFIEDGGYDRATLWMSAGWAKREADRWSEPFYWERRDGEWWTFTLSGMRRVDPFEPVCHLTWFEADAFARWASARLPREDEWEVAARGLDVAGNFVESGRLHPAPLGANARGLSQMFGDVWEWTASDYSPYPGYRPEEGAIGEYNGKFMCGQFVLRGGSCVTPVGHIRHTYRNFFVPESAWQFTGLRLARDP